MFADGRSGESDLVGNVSKRGLPGLTVVADLDSGLQYLPLAGGQQTGERVFVGSVVPRLSDGEYAKRTSPPS